MKEAKRVKQAIDSIDKIVTYLDYFMHNSSEFKRLMREDIGPTVELIRELATDQKIQNARLAQKIKEAYQEGKLPNVDTKNK